MINYQLKRKDISKPQPIFAYITGVFIGSKERLKISIGKSILPQDFGEEIDNYKFNRDRLNKSKKPCTMLVCIRKKILSKSSRSCNIPECSPAALKKRPPQKALPPKRPSARKKKPAGQPNAGQRLKNGPGSGSAGCCCLLFFFSL